ncbi:hypothetical protein SDC9_181783 [bioreactor metagenome]|uniref:Uncharacterized protein n=1 Tax=bioreactor metagenome TaxID=1076179 RepID=A0A645H6G2_9ZZZZ
MGTTNVVAITREATTKLRGRVPETSIASICSVTVIAAISAAIPELIFPAQISPVMTGPSSRTMDTAITPGNNVCAPKSARTGFICMVSTSPMIKPVTTTSASDLLPSKNPCLMNSLNSKGGWNICLITFPVNNTSSPRSINTPL